MEEEKLFYKYQSLEKVKDKNGNDRQYTIENLANYQLYFQHPREYNDPFDSVIHYYAESTIEAYIDKVMKGSQLTREQIIEDIENSIKDGLFKRYGDLIRQEMYGKDLFPLPLTCCFSEKNDDVLMWSHYAKYHKGICLSFKAKLIEGKPHLTVNSKALRLYPMNYDLKAPEPINLHNQIEEMGQISKFLSTKSSGWEYENEYRMFLQEEEVQGNLNEFKKEELEGIIFGSKVSFYDANKIYETINKHYLRGGINVNFYVAELFLSEYKIRPKEIDINSHLRKLFNNAKLKTEFKRKQQHNRKHALITTDF
jgi:hypothetical protein